MKWLGVVSVGLMVFPKVTLGADPELLGWYLSGNAKQKYSVAADRDTTYDGNASARLSSIESADGDEFGTLMQQIDAQDYQDKVVSLQGFLRTRNVKGRAALWMRLDGANRELINLDNMSEQPLIVGDHEWTQFRIDMYVPKEAVFIAFGVLLTSTGDVWMDNIKLVERDPVSELLSEQAGKFRPASRLPGRLINGGFEGR